MGDPRISRIPAIVTVLGLMLGGCAQMFDNQANSPSDGAQSAMAAQGASGGELPGMTTASGDEPGLHPAAMTVVNLGREAMTAMADRSLTDTQRADKFRSLLARDIDVPLIGRFVLGRYWRKTTPEQRQAYLRIYAEFILSAYVTQIDGAGVEHFDIIKTQAHGTNDFLVHCQIARRGTQPVLAIWRVRKSDDRYRIIDLMLAGVSMAQTQRQEFVSLIRANGGSVDGLIQTLKEKAMAQQTSRQASVN